MLIVKDIYGNEEGFVGYKGLKRNRTKDGEKTLAFLAIPDENNEHSYPLIQNESTVEFDGDLYRVKQLKEKSRGKVTIKEVVAIHTFFDLIDEHIYEIHNGSMTFENAVQFVLGPYGYTWDIVGTFYAQDWENFGDNNPIALFQDLMKRYKAEFTLNGTHLTFKNKIGNATDFQLRYNYNIKSIEKNSDSLNFSTYIRGFGKDGLVAEYISPLDEANGGPFKRKHAKPVRDERYTSHAGLMERLQSEIPSTIPFSVTVDFVDLRRAGYPYDVPNEGDDMFVIHEPMNMDLEARIMVIDEEFTEGNSYPIKTNVTIANYRNNMTDKFIEFSRTQKTVNAIVEGNQKLPYSVVDDAILRATEALQSAQTEVEFNNGFIFRSKENPNLLVLANSAGIGVSTDGGQTFRTAMTAQGIVADLITAGTMMFDRLRGGIMKLGEGEFGNGEAHVLDQNGNVVGRIDLNGVYSPRVQADNIVGNVVNKYKAYVNEVWYFDCDNGDDANLGEHWIPKKDPQVFLNSLPKDLNGSTITLRCKGSRSGTLIVRGFRNGILIVTDWYNDNGFNVNAIWIEDNTCPITWQYTNVWGTGGNGNAMAHSFNSRNVFFYSVKCYGGSGQSHAFWFYSSTVRMGECHVYNINDRGMYANEHSRVYMWNCHGTAPVAILVNDGSHVDGTGSRWAGSFVRYANALIGSVGLNNVDWEMNLWSIDYGEATPPPPPPLPPATEQTITVTPVTGDNYSTQGFWTNDEVKQGNWGYGDRYGLWYVDLSAVKGKTILSASITVKRGSGGTNAARTIHFRAHTYTSRSSRPSGAPALSGVLATGSLAVGQEGTFDITSLVQYIANGVDKSIGVYTTGQTDYMSLNTTPTITIRYQ